MNTILLNTFEGDEVVVFTKMSTSTGMHVVPIVCHGLLQEMDDEYIYLANEEKEIIDAIKISEIFRIVRGDHPELNILEEELNDKGSVFN